MSACSLRVYHSMSRSRKCRRCGEPIVMARCSDTGRSVPFEASKTKVGILSQADGEEATARRFTAWEQHRCVARNRDR